MIKWELTEEQAENLIRLLDVAVKAGGVQTARPALALLDSLAETMQADQNVSHDGDNE